MGYLYSFLALFVLQRVQLDSKKSYQLKVLEKYHRGLTFGLWTTFYYGKAVQYFIKGVTSFDKDSQFCLRFLNF